MNARKAGEKYWMDKVQSVEEYDFVQVKGENKKAQVKCPIPKSLITGIEKLGNHDPLTEMAVYLAFYGILLRKYFNAEHFSMLSNALSTSTNDQIMSLFTMTVRGDDKITDLLHLAKNEIEEVLGYQENSYEEIKTLLANNHVDAQHMHVFGFNMSGQQPLFTFPSFFTLKVDKEASELTCSYDESVFEKTLIEHLGNSYVYILEKGLEHLSAKIAELEVLPSGSRNAVIHKTNLFEVKHNNIDTVVRRFEQIVASFPERIAVRFNGNTYSYQELNQMANHIAHQLIERYNVNRGDHVGLILSKSEWMIASILGVLKAGAAYVPINPEDPTERKNHILKDAGVSTVINDEEDFPDLDLSYVPIADLVENQPEDVLPNPGLPTTSKDECYIIYTSGTTGKPKGVIITHENVVQLFFNDGFPFQFDEHDCWSFFHNYNFDFSVWEIFGALLHGGKLVVVTKGIFFNPLTFIRLLVEEKVTVLNQTPSSFSAIMAEVLQQEKHVPLPLRYVVFGGEALKPASLEPWASVYPDIQLINMYGITETTVHVTYKQINKADISDNVSNVGKPLAPVSLYVLNQDGQVLPEGCIGEIYVGGAGVAKGYANNEALTAKKFVHLPELDQGKLYRTGDLGSITNSGEVLYYGRKDKQFSIRGYRIEAGEIENTLLTHPVIDDAKVLARTNQLGEKELVAFVISSEPIPVELVLNFANETLPGYMVPVRVHILKEKPINKNGKIDEHALTLLDDASRQARTLIQPENITEQALLALWKKVLKTENISVTDDFFGIGGDSIKVIKLLNQIKLNISKALEIHNMFEYKTIRDQANFILLSHGASEEEEAAADIPSKLWILQEEINSDPRSSTLLGDAVESIYPMSDIEIGMIFHNYLYKETGVYHDQFVYQFEEEDFDYEILNRAFNSMLDKHEILRTSFFMDDFSEPVQVVHHAKTCYDRLIFKDLSDSKQQAHNDLIQAYMSQDRQNYFEVKKPGLWRMVIFKMSEQEYSLLWVFHHAILDGWSNASFIVELIDTYHKMRQKGTYRPAFLSASYRDAVVEQLTAKSSNKQKDYWTQYLKDYKRTALPFKSTVAKNVDSASKRVTYFHINEEKTQHYKKFVQEHQIPIKDLLFAGFLYMLRMACDQKDLTIGLVSHFRPAQDDGDKVLGCFLNTVPFRLDLADRDIDVFEFLGQVSQSHQLSKQHDRFPFLEIAKLVEKDDHLNPIFDIKFDFVDFYVYGDVLEKTEAARQKDYIKPFTRTNTAFDFNTSVRNDAILTTISYPGNIYTDKEVDFIHQLYEVILDLLTSSTRINDQLIEERLGWWSTKSEPLTYSDNESKDTWLNMFEDRVLQTPDTKALVFQETTLTYKELNDEAEKLAFYLRNDLEMSKGSHVAILLPRSDLFIISMIAAFKAGVTFIPLDTGLPLERIKLIIGDADVQAVLTDHYNMFQLTDLSGPQIVTLDIQLPILEVPEAGWETSVHADDAAYLIYTSGSTGTPKGVVINHAAIHNYTQWFIDAHDLTQKDRTLIFSSLAFDLSYTTLFTSLVAGAELHLWPEQVVFNVSDWSSYISKNEITFLKLTPSHLTMIVSDPAFPERYDKSKVRLFVVGGEKFRANDAKIYLSYFPETQFVNHYGPTETTIGCITQRIDVENIDYQLFNPLIGHPIQQHEVLVLNEDDQPLYPGQEGEICIKGAGLAKGYYKNESLTLSKFASVEAQPEIRLYHTGDIGKQLPGGAITFHGRKDDQVKIKGFRIELGEIESCISGVDGVSNFAVLALENNIGENELTLFLETTAAKEEKGIRQAMLQKLPAYMVPQRFKYVEQLPLTANGKVDKVKLVKEATTIKPIASAEPSSFEGETELKIYGIWEDILGRSDISPDAKFFDLGGDSLSLVRLAKRLSEDLSSSLEVADFFNYTTIREIAEQLNDAPDRAAPTKGIEI